MCFILKPLKSSGLNIGLVIIIVGSNDYGVFLKKMLKNLIKFNLNFFVSSAKSINNNFVQFRCIV